LKIYINCPVSGMSKQQSIKTVTRKVMHMTPAKNYSVSAVEIEKEM